MKFRIESLLTILISIIFLFSFSGFLVSCANPHDPRGIEEINEESEDEESEDEESEDEDSEDEESEDEESEDEESEDEESEDEESEEEEDLDPYDQDFYLDHPEVTGGTIFADDFWIGSQTAGSESWVKVKLYNSFERTVKVRVAIEGSSSIVEFNAPVGFLITGEIPFMVPESLGWHNLMITILDSAGNILYHDKTTWFVQIK